MLFKTLVSLAVRCRLLINGVAPGVYPAILMIVSSASFDTANGTTRMKRPTATTSDARRVFINVNSYGANVGQKQPDYFKTDHRISRKISKVPLFYWSNRQKRQSWPFGAASTLGLGDSLKFSGAISQCRPNPKKLRRPCVCE